MSTNARLGFDIVAVNQTGQAFASVQKDLARAGQMMKGFAGPMQSVGSGATKFGQQLQQASLQIGDFAVQVGSGTDATRALAQQLPQLLGGMGVFGAVAGAAVAVLLPLAQAMSKNRDYAKELAEGVDKLDAVQKISSATIVELTEQYGRYANVVSLVARAQGDLAKLDITRTLVDQAKAISDLNSGYAGTAGAFGEIANQLRNADFGRSAIAQLFSPLDDAANKVNFLKDKFSLTEQAARGLMGPFMDFQTAVKNTNTEAASLALEQFSKWIIQNKNDAATAIPLLDQMRAQFQALSKLSPPSKAPMGFSMPGLVTTTTRAYNNTAGDAKVAEQLAAMEQRAADAKNAVAEAARLAAEAQRRQTSEFETFISTISRGVTPLQRIQDAMRQAQDQFAAFGSKMNPEQLAAFDQYMSDLNAKMNEIAFKKQWEDMSKDIDAVTASMAPLKEALDSIGSGFKDVVGNFSGAFAQIISGTASVKDAFANMAMSISQTLEQLAAELLKSSILQLLKYLPGLLAGGGGAGINIGGMVFGGLFADGGHLGAGKWGIAGEAGPEIVHGPANITPMNKMGGEPRMSVQINNYAGAQVQTREGADGRLEIDIIKAEIAKDFMRGGNPLALAVERGYGLRRAGR